MTDKTGLGTILADLMSMALYSIVFLLLKRQVGFDNAVLIGLAVLLTFVTKISFHIIFVPGKPEKP